MRGLGIIVTVVEDAPFLKHLEDAENIDQLLKTISLSSIHWLLGTIK
jgi:hypothetical protein